MQIKVFKAGNMKDAMTAMKAELGEDAVILHSKKYKEGGILGIGSREVVEITAAVEESSLPKKIETTKLHHPTVATNSLVNRYKTDGTAQGVAKAEQTVEIFSAESNREDSQHSIQIDELADKISEQKNKADAPKDFEEILQERQSDSFPTNLSETKEYNLAEETLDEKSQPADDESVTDEKSQPADDESSTDEKSQPVDDESVTDEKSQPVDDESSTDEKSQPVGDESSTDEKSQPVGDESSTDEKSQPVDDKSAIDEKSQPVDDKSSTDEKSQPIINKSALAEKSQSVANEPAPAKKSQSVANKPARIKKSQSVANEPASVEKTQSQQQASGFTQEQMAQTQAMIMAQFNQMQMMQQAAIAQAQAQAAEQIRLQQAQQAAVQAQPLTQNEEKIKRLEEEIAQMKALLTEILGRESNKIGISLHEALKMQEVDEEILKEMAAQANAGDTLVDMHTPAARATLENYLNEHVKFSEGVKLNRHGVRIVALLGTTGVGKTTTLAKIAAKFVLEQRTNVALITADTYRISAVEQLKTYSDILELPLEIVYNPQELATAIERHRHKELILIDTAGRSQHNEYQMRELEEFLRVNPRIEKHLVISATTKFTDARQIMNKFSQVNPDKIIFTKIDETGSLGMILNLLNDNKYSLSYITTGQSVPDDIESASAEVLTNLLLRKVEE